jgi:hypothetical protein
VEDAWAVREEEDPVVTLRKEAEPPDVTLGVALLVLGAMLPVLPVEPEFEVAEELWPVLLVTPDELLEVAVPALELDAPGCSWATTTPMPSVVPVATSRAPLVKVRRRARAWSLLAPAFGTFCVDISFQTFGRGQHPWDHFDIGPPAEPAVGLL